MQGSFETEKGLEDVDVKFSAVVLSFFSTLRSVAYVPCT